MNSGLAGPERAREAVHDENPDRSRPPGESPVTSRKIYSLELVVFLAGYGNASIFRTRHSAGGELHRAFFKCKFRTTLSRLFSVSYRTFFFFFFLGRCDGILITGRVHFDAPLHFPRSAWRPDLYLESDQLLIGIFQFFFSFE